MRNTSLNIQTRVTWIFTKVTEPKVVTTWNVILNGKAVTK